MAEGNIGGGGSVHWVINADDVEMTEEPNVRSGRRSASDRRWIQHGRDYHGRNLTESQAPAQQDFVVRLKVPADSAKAAAFLAALRNAAPIGNIVEFTLPVEDGNDVARPQIQVCWGDNIPSWRDGVFQEIPGSIVEKVPKPEPV